jgi:DNA-binding transcriptional regulator YdaS (Cro superfamily)
VKIYLEETGRKKKWLAAQLGISPSTLSEWLTGKISFSEKRIHDILNIISSNP